MDNALSPLIAEGLRSAGHAAIRIRDHYMQKATGPSRSEEWASVHRNRNPQTIENSDLAHKVRQRLANETTVNRAMQADVVLTERLFYRT